MTLIPQVVNKIISDEVLLFLVFIGLGGIFITIILTLFLYLHSKKPDFMQKGWEAQQIILSQGNVNLSNIEGLFSDKEFKDFKQKMQGFAFLHNNQIHSKDSVKKSIEGLIIVEEKISLHDAGVKLGIPKTVIQEIIQKMTDIILLDNESITSTNVLVKEHINSSKQREIYYKDAAKQLNLPINVIQKATYNLTDSNDIKGVFSSNAFIKISREEVSKWKKELEEQGQVSLQSFAEKKGISEEHVQSLCEKITRPSGFFTPQGFFISLERAKMELMTNLDKEEMKSSRKKPEKLERGSYFSAREILLCSYCGTRAYREHWTDWLESLTFCPNCKDQVVL